MPLDLTDDKSTLVQVMAWCHQSTSHYLSQCWPRSMSPYGVTRPQWVNSQFCGFKICGILKQDILQYWIWKRTLSDRTWIYCHSIFRYVTGIWHCCKHFSQCECSFQWKLHCHWVKCLWQCQITVVIQGPMTWIIWGGSPYMAATVSYPDNSLRPRQNGRHFADDIFKCIFVNENVWILIIISLKFVPKGLINNIPALVQIMAWHRTGDKPLSEPMMTQFNDAYLCPSASMS